MKKIAFIIHALQCGGAERVLALMANYWAARGYSIDILTMDDGVDSPFYPLHSAIRHHPLNLLTRSTQRCKAYYENLQRLGGIRRALRDIQPDCVISFIDIMNLFSIVAALGLKIPVVVSERSDPFQYKIGRHWEFLRHRLYPLADAIVVQSDDISSYFSERLHPKIHTIPNPVFAPSPNGAGSWTLPKPSILAVGRFTFEKGFRQLVQAFANLHPRHPEWHLVLVGDGPLRPELEELRGQLALQDVVHMPGRIADIYSVYAQAEMFVLSSLFEGFPNVLCEAMASGLPVIATRCSYGPIAIVRPEQDGLQIPPDDIPALEHAMEKLIVHPELRIQYGRSAREILERYRMDTIMKQWDDLLFRVIKK